MRARQLIAMGAAAATLFILMKVMRKDDSSARMQSVSTTTTSKVFFPKFDRSKIAEIVIRREAMADAVLHRTSETSWTLQTRRGPRPVRVARELLMLGSRENPEPIPDQAGTLRGEKAESQASFGTDAKAGRDITFRDAAGAEMAHIILGWKSANPRDSVYVRVPDSPETYVLGVDLNDNFKLERPSDFLDPVIFRGTKAIEFDDIHVERHDDPTKSYSIKRTNTDPTNIEWECTVAGKTQHANTSNAETVASSLNLLTIKTFADDIPDTDMPNFSSPKATVTFRRKGLAEPIVLKILAAPDLGMEMSYAETSAYPDPFTTNGLTAVTIDPVILLPYDEDGPDS